MEEKKYLDEQKYQKAEKGITFIAILVLVIIVLVGIAGYTYFHLTKTKKAEEEKKVYYTISGKEQQYNPQWEAYSISDFDVGEELEGVPEVTLFENEDKSYDAARLRLIDEDEIVNLYFNFPKKAYPIVRNLKNIRTGEKDKFDFYINCYDVCFSVLRCLDENNIKDSNGETINKIKAINLETVLTIIDTSNKVKVRIIEGSPYNDYKSWGIISME